MPKAAKSYENPLIPHARMRALYRALVETRVLSERLPRVQRIPKGLEACWAGTALGLEEGDLTSDRAATSLPGYVRAIATRAGNAAPRRPQVEALLSAVPQAFTGSAQERLFCAIGAAMALKAAGTRGAAVAYVRAGELQASDWVRVLRVASVGDLPLILVALAAEDVPLSSRSVPVIPVDAADAVAIYRVAQESLLRARAEGGVAVIECVATGLDPVVLLAEQLKAKGISTPAWISGVETTVRGLLSDR